MTKLSKPDTIYGVHAKHPIQDLSSLYKYIHSTRFLFRFITNNYSFCYPDFFTNAPNNIYLIEFIVVIHSKQQPAFQFESFMSPLT